MRKFLLFVAFFLASPVLGKGPEQFLDVQDFHCGIDSYHSSLTIDDCHVQEALNGYFDKDAAFVKRGGYTTAFSSKTYSYSGLWSYQDTSGNIWMVARSSDTIMATTGIGTSNFNIKIATVSASNTVNAVSAFGNIYFVDQTQGVYYWNGTSTTYVSGSPHGQYIAEFHGRIWVAGLAVPNGLQLYGSKYLDGTTWTTGSLATDPVVLTVSLADNYDVITALSASFSDVMHIFGNYHIHSLIGFDQTNFQVSLISKEIGCIDQGSVQPYLGGIVFASPRGIEFFDGYKATRISDPIKNRIDSFTLGSYFNSNSWAQSNQSDFETGSSSPTNSLSTTISPGDVIVSSFGYTDLTVGTSNFSDSFSSIGNWTPSGSYGTNMSVTGNTAICAGGGDCRSTSNQLVNNDFLIHFTATRDPNSGSARFIMVGAFDSGNKGYYIQLSATPSNAIQICETNNFLAGVDDTCQSVVCSASNASTPITVDLQRTSATNTLAVYFNGTIICSGVDSTVTSFQRYGMAIGAMPGGAISGFQATPRMVTSPVQDTSFKTSKMMLQSNYTAGTSTPSFSVFSSSSVGGPFTSVVTSTGTTGTGNEFIYYSSTITPVSPGTTLPIIGSVSFVARSTGTYYSAVHNVSSMNSWGNFSVDDVSNGGTITYFVRSATSSFTVLSSTPAWAPQIKNSIITSSTGTYFQMSSTFSITLATQTPTLNDFTFNWNVGSRKPPMASMVYDNRYWLSVTTNTADSSNDGVLVLSKGPIWTRFSIHAGAFINWKNQPYFADADSTGYTYQLEQGLNDNGTAIDSWFKTKDYAPGGIIKDKVWDKFYMVANNEGNYNIYTNYYTDRVATGFSLGTVVQNETPGTLLANLNIPIDATHQNFSRTISLKFQNNDIDAPFKFYGGSLKYHLRPAQ